MSSNLQICAIPDDLKARLREFRFSKKESMNAIIIKVDREAQTLKIDEEMDDCSLEEICQELPEQQPRYILLSYTKKMSDGRLTFPMCLIFYSPLGCLPDLQMLYAGSRNSLVNECELTKNFEVRDIEELTQEYIDTKCT